MPLPIPSEETRSLQELREQFEVERELAGRLRRADKDERGELYGRIYEEFTRRVPHQPLLARRNDPDAQRHQVALQQQLLDPFLTAQTTFLEVGSGDAALSVHLAGRVRQVIVVEPCAEMHRGVDRPANLRLLEDGAAPLDVAAASVDVAFSCHFIEHLHPDDVADHLAEMRRILAPGGRYVCITPNRLYGPHDISRYFEDEPAGLHLKEYDHGEIATLLHDAGFRRVAVLQGIGRPPVRRPTAPYRVAEALLARLPLVRRRWVLRQLSRRTRPPFRPLEQVVLLGER